MCVEIVVLSLIATTDWYRQAHDIIGGIMVLIADRAFGKAIQAILLPYAKRYPDAFRDKAPKFAVYLAIYWVRWRHCHFQAAANVSHDHFFCGRFRRSFSKAQGRLLPAGNLKKLSRHVKFKTLIWGTM
jgi:hypothetical protein